MVARFPDVEWKVTAGNSSQLTDGAAALLLMSEARARQLGLRPRARILGVVRLRRRPDPDADRPDSRDSPDTGARRIGIDEVDAIEINEAFASVPLAWQEEFGVADDRLNPRGGAIALGHPLGASGARLMTTLINQLEATGGRLGLQTMCEAGGMANATLIERIS